MIDAGTEIRTMLFQDDDAPPCSDTFWTEVLQNNDNFIYGTVWKGAIYNMKRDPQSFPVLYDNTFPFELLTFFVLTI